MKKMVIKKIIVGIAICLILISMVTESNATNFDVDVFESGGETTQVDNLINNSTATVAGVLRIVSVTISTVVLLVIAMKYMIAAPGDKADIKKHAVAYVTGTVILFAATQIIAVLIDVAAQIKP